MQERADSVKKKITAEGKEGDRPALRRNRDRLRVPKVAELVASQIRSRIVRGEVKEGDPLLPEGELMTQFGVSRPTLREAFRILESESLITVTRGSRGGARVHAPEIGTVARYAGLLLQYRETTLEDVQAARAVVEPPAAAMLARRANPQACEQLRELIEQQKTVIDDPDAFAELSTRFHERLMELAGNETLALVVGMLHDIVERHAASSLGRLGLPDEKTVQKAIRSQERLVDLVEAGDEKGAEAHWRRHVAAAGQSVLSSTGPKSVVDLFD